MFVKVADGPGLGAVPARRPVPRMIRTPRATYLRVPLMLPRGMGALSPQAQANYDAWIASGGGAATNPGVNPNGALLSKPGPNGGTEIVDPNGNIVYSEGQVNANPSLLNLLNGACPPGTRPTWFPGGESTCAGTAQGPEGTVLGPQFNYPINGACPVAGWCFTGTNLRDPNSYTWTGGGSPNVLNPALAYAGMDQGLPSTYQPGGTVFTGGPIMPGPPQLSPTAIAVGRDPIPVPPSYDPISTLAPPPAPVVRPAVASISNTSRPGQPFQVGDAWKLTITGTPGQPVAGTASQNGQSLGTTPYGSTDGNGQLVLTGAMDASTVGNWSELWTVGTVSAPVLAFSVSPAPAGSGAPIGGGSTTADAASTSSTSGISDFLTQSVSIAGMDLPLWGVIAAGVGGLMLFSGGKR